MTSYVPPKVNTAFITYIGLFSQADTRLLQSNPTLATGDVKVSTDGAAFGNITTLPTVTPASGRAVKVSLSASEMNGDNIVVQFVDAAGAEWCDAILELQTSATQESDTASSLAAIKAKTDNLTATPASTGDAMTLTSGERNSVADALLDRDMSTGTDSGSPTIRTVRQALRFFRNKWSIVGSIMTVYKEDDTTASWTSAIGTTSGVDPITSNDPTGP